MIGGLIIWLICLSRCYSKVLLNDRRIDYLIDLCFALFSNGLKYWFPNLLCFHNMRAFRLQCMSVKECTGRRTYMCFCGFLWCNLECVHKYISVCLCVCLCLFSGGKVKAADWPLIWFVFLSLQGFWVEWPCHDATAVPHPTPRWPRRACLAISQSQRESH